MVSVDGSLLLREKNCEIQSGIESRAAVAVFALPGVKSCESCLDLSARKVKGKLRDASFKYVNPRMAKTCKVSMAVSETSDMSHDLFFPCCCKCTEVCAYREAWGLKLEQEPYGVCELPVEILSHNARTTGKNLGSVSSLSELDQIEETIANSEYPKCLKRARQ